MEHWEDKITVKKGNVGERIIQEIFETNGFIVYRPITKGPHKTDYFLHSGFEKKIICCDVKTKRRYFKTPKTGLNESSFYHYKEILEKHNIDVLLVFIDDFEERIYGNWLSEIKDKAKYGNNNETPLKVWHLKHFKMIRKLTEEELNELKPLTTKKYKEYYLNTPLYFTEDEIQEIGYLQFTKINTGE